MREIRNIATAALALSLAAAPAAAHMTPACLGAILNYSAGAASQTAIAIPLAGADEATAVARRPILAELKRKTSRALEAAFRECIELDDGETAPPDERGPTRGEGRRSGAD